MTIMTEGEYRYNILIKTFASAPEPAFPWQDDSANALPAETIERHSSAAT